jgi:hypothetical protein
VDVVPETSVSVTPPPIRLGPPSSVSVRAPGATLPVSIGSLKVASTVVTATLVGLGVTGAID